MVEVATDEEAAAVPTVGLVEGVLVELVVPVVGVVGVLLPLVPAGPEDLGFGGGFPIRKLGVKPSRAARCKCANQSFRSVLKREPWLTAKLFRGAVEYVALNDLSIAVMRFGAMS
jgi:hypothetical protein